LRTNLKLGKRSCFDVDLEALIPPGGNAI
jgi:hypothetical protein